MENFPVYRMFARISFTEKSTVVKKVVFGIILFLAAAKVAWCAETDQFLSWGVEIKDCSEAFNRYYNENIQICLDRINRRVQPVENSQEVVETIYFYFFQGLHSSRIRGWLFHSKEVERYPNTAVSTFEYQKLSIFRGLAFPYKLPMSRTVRIGDVYTGIDKISHFCDFGRRYFQRYCRYRAEGMPEEEAMEKVVRWGIFQEESMVGKLVDGVFSHGDLEANFQGFLLARDMCGGEKPYIVRENGVWRLARPVDLRKYVTPGFDESYNTSHYWALRERNVLPIIKREYCPKRSLPSVQARFARYREWQPSFSQKIIAAYFAGKESNPQQAQSLDVICAECKAAEEDAQTAKASPAAQ